MIRYLVRFGLWLARWGGWAEMPPAPPCSRPHLPDMAYLDTARLVYHEIERQHFKSGETKRHNALRALLNRHPEARERDLALALELVIQEMP